MDDLYFEIMLAKEGDVIANERIIEKYRRYIKYMINKYEIIDKNTCYDEVRRNILKAIQKINFENF